MTLDIVILAAGQGTRMKSALPKVLHTIAGKPMLCHVLDTARQLNPEAIHIVVGHGADHVREAINDDHINWVTQAEQKGTGHALQQAAPHLNPNGTTLVLYGDVPLTRLETLQNLLHITQDQRMGLLTVALDEPTGYGRIIRDSAQAVTAIVEEKDASAEQKQVQEINTGILAAPTAFFLEALPTLSSNNAQGEYYLTDTIAYAVSQGLTVSTAQPLDVLEVQGVNNRKQQAELERYQQRRSADQLMVAGVTLLDPNRIDIRGSLSVGSDSLIDVNCVFEGDVTLGNHVVIGANCHIKDAVIGDHTQIQPFSSVEASTVGARCTVGPYARLRPGTELAQGAKIGNFVETKKARVGEGSKINHLSYIGDAELGRDVNVGAGTITCNYDGVNKYRTQIGDNVFVGSNTSLVAPVEVGDGATVGAGSTITKTVEAGELAISRARQRNIGNWQKPTKTAKDHQPE